MHIPDGFINNGTTASTLAAAVTAVGFALKKVRASFLEKIPVIKARLATFPDFSGGSEKDFQNRLSQYGREKIWRLATVGALIFSSQMMNFPIGGGMSGHLLGGVLAALIVGPFEALLVMTLVLALQAFMFGDGGVLALGANVFNMGVVGVLGGFYFFKFLARNVNAKKKNFLKNAFVAAWLSVIAAAVLVSLEIWLSGTLPLETVLPEMFMAHTMIGFGEGIITVVVLAFLIKKNYQLEILSEEKIHEEYNGSGSAVGG